MVSAADVVRRHRKDGVLGVGVTLLVVAACSAVPSNALMRTSVAIIGGMALLEFVVAARVVGPTDADTLRRESRLLRWSPLWYALPMTGAPILFVEGVSRLLGEHAPPPIVLAMLAVGVGASILCRVEASRLERHVSARG